MAPSVSQLPHSTSDLTGDRLGGSELVEATAPLLVGSGNSLPSGGMLGESARGGF